MVVVGGGATHFPKRNSDASGGKNGSEGSWLRGDWEEGWRGVCGGEETNGCVCVGGGGGRGGGRRDEGKARQDEVSSARLGGAGQDEEERGEWGGGREGRRSGRRGVMKVTSFW